MRIKLRNSICHHAAVAFAVAIFCIDARPAPEPPSTKPISLQDALILMGEISPLMRQARERIKGADAGVRIAQSEYLPQISAQGLWSNGNAGVFSVAGVDANLGTASRIGEGLGLDLKQNVYDFGRAHHEIAAEEARRQTEQASLETQKSEAQRELLRVYVDCSYLTSTVSTSERIVELTKMVGRETDRFVKSGQRSIIERYLVDSQTEETETRVAETETKLVVVQRRLARLLQLPADNLQKNQFTCRGLSELLVEAKAIKPASEFNAFLKVENERLKQFEERQKFARADYMPRIFLEAQGGFFRSENVDQGWNYGVGLGITLPLYTGDRIESKVDEAQALYDYQRAVIARTTERVEQDNLGYDEQIESLHVRLAYLEKENQLALKVFGIARSRYTKFQGSMIDLRDSIRELSRVLDELDRTKAQLSQAIVERSLWNEAFVR